MLALLAGLTISLGPRVVLLAGDEEYRSEEMLPALAKLLGERHGFRCTVLYSLNRQGEIGPEERARQPGLEALKEADVCVMMLRFRQWPDAEMRFFAEYVQAGKPLIALRTSTHAFDYPADSPSPYATYAWNREGGFGKQVLGETWISHWGQHGVQATRGHVVADHPVTKGVKDIFVPTDVYEAAPPKEATILVRGEVVNGMNSNARSATGRKRTRQGVEQALNEPMMPVVWVRNKVVTCTMGSAQDFENPGFRRLLVNAVKWLSGKSVSGKESVDLVGPYSPSPFGFGTFRRGVKPPAP